MSSKIFTALLITLILLPGTLLAAGGNGNGTVQFVPIIGIPGVDPQSGFGAYINALYALAISLAALIAVIKIIIAGAKYMLSDIVSTKSAAKEDIKNSLLGLLIIIGAVIILSTINVNLTNTTIFAEPVGIDDTPIPPGVIIGTIDEGTVAVTCENAQQWRQLGTPPSVTSCRERCRAVNGRFEQRTLALSEGRCWISEEAVNTALEEVEGNLIEEHCPDGSTGCIVQNCDIYGDGGAINLTSCEQFCDARGGVHFDPGSTNCVIPGQTTSSTESCEQITGDGVSSVNTWDCSAAITRCNSRGGFSAGDVRSAPTINCVVNEVEISPEVQAAVCTGGTGYSCTIIPCGATGLFSSCSSWCWNNGRHTYNSQYGVCYTNARQN